MWVIFGEVGVSNVGNKIYISISLGANYPLSSMLIHSQIHGSSVHYSGNEWIYFYLVSGLR